MSFSVSQIRNRTHIQPTVVNTGHCLGAAAENTEGLLSCSLHSGHDRQNISSSPARAWPEWWPAQQHRHHLPLMLDLVLHQVPCIAGIQQAFAEQMLILGTSSYTDFAFETHAHGFRGAAVHTNPFSGVEVESRVALRSHSSGFLVQWGEQQG